MAWRFETINKDGISYVINYLIQVIKNNFVSGVKGDAEASYRNGKVNITKNNIGLTNVENKSSETIRNELTKPNVTKALGYTPLNQSDFQNVNFVSENGYGNLRYFNGKLQYKESNTWKDIIPLNAGESILITNKSS